MGAVATKLAQWLQNGCSGYKMGAVVIKWAQWLQNGRSGYKMGAVATKWVQWLQNGRSGFKVGAVASKLAQRLQNKSLSVFSTFSIYFTKRRQRTRAWNLLSDCEFRDSELHGRAQMNFLPHFPQILLDSGKILRKAFVFESSTCCLRFVPVKLSHYLFTFPVTVLSYK